MFLVGKSHVEKERISLNNKQLREESSFLISYSGCVTLKSVDPCEHASALRGQIDFMIPRREHGLVQINFMGAKGRSYNQPFLVRCSSDDVNSIKGKLLIRARNVLFIDAMLFVKHKEKTYHIEKNHGPMYLYLINSEFYSLWNQLMSKSEN